jgi:hypothetical protein
LCDEASGTCVACFADADCNDADSCTNDACSAGACVYSYAEGASCEPSWGLQNPASASPSVGWAAAAYDPIADRVIVFGGNSASGAQDATWSWDGTNWTQLFPATSPSARYSHGMAYDPMLGRIVLFGGLSAPGMSNALADTWEWDGTTWTEVTP